MSSESRRTSELGESNGGDSQVKRTTEEGGRTGGRVREMVSPNVRWEKKEEVKGRGDIVGGGLTS